MPEVEYPDSRGMTQCRGAVVYGLQRDIIGYICRVNHCLLKAVCQSYCLLSVRPSVFVSVWLSVLLSVRLPVRLPACWGRLSRGVACPLL